MSASASASLLLRAAASAPSTSLLTLRTLRTTLAASQFVRFHERKPKPEPRVLSRAVLEDRAQAQRMVRDMIEQRRATEPVAPLAVQHTAFSAPFFQPEHAHAAQSSQQPQQQQSQGAAAPASSPLQFAIIDINGNQHKVVEDDLLMTDLLKAEVGKEVVFTKVLLLGTRDATWIGRPCVPNAEVHAVVEEHTQTQKVLVFHKKRRKNHRKLRGYRHDVTLLRIVRIVNPSLASAESPAAATASSTA